MITVALNELSAEGNSANSEAHAYSLYDRPFSAILKLRTELTRHYAYLPVSIVATIDVKSIELFASIPFIRWLNSTPELERRSILGMLTAPVRPEWNPQYTFEENEAAGLGLAVDFDGISMSFSIAEQWENSLLRVRQILLGDNIEPLYSVCEVRNIANSEHVTEHLSFIVQTLAEKTTRKQYDLNSSDYPRDYETCLCDTDRFDYTGRQYYSKSADGKKKRSAKIYKEKNTMNRWYVDVDHYGRSSHLEVFDRRGNHLGEADLDGIIDVAKVDKEKFLKL